MNVDERYVAARNVIATLLFLPGTIFGLAVLVNELGWHGRTSGNIQGLTTLSGMLGTVMTPIGIFMFWSYRRTLAPFVQALFYLSMVGLVGFILAYMIPFFRGD